MNTAFWRHLLWQLAIGAILLATLVFAVKVTADLHAAEAGRHTSAVREPQSADPLEAFIEVTAPPAPLPLLSGGFAGIAPSIHLIRLNNTLPLAHIDPIEHPARRRYGRVDITFAILYVTPLALLPLAFLAGIQIRDSRAAERFLAGGKGLGDFVIERLLLPLSGWFALCLAAILSAMYAYGLRFDSNEAMLRVALWVAAAGLYVLLWVLLFLYLTVRTRSLAAAVAGYGICFLVLAFLLPAAQQSIALAMTRPESRTAISVERRRLSQLNSRIDAGLVSRLAERSGVPNAFADSTPAAQRSITALALEETLQPRIDDFHARVNWHERASSTLAWLSPATLTQTALDDLAGSGSARYGAFRDQATRFSLVWRGHMLPLLIQKKFLDYDALKATPRFRFEDEAVRDLLLRTVLKLALLAGLAGWLLWAIWGGVQNWRAEAEIKKANP